jgi:hypothetical protein
MLSINVQPLQRPSLYPSNLPVINHGLDMMVIHGGAFEIIVARACSTGQRPGLCVEIVGFELFASLGDTRKLVAIGDC